MTAIRDDVAGEHVEARVTSIAPAMPSTDDVVRDLVCVVLDMHPRPRTWEAAEARDRLVDARALFEIQRWRASGEPDARLAA